MKAARRIKGQRGKKIEMMNTAPLPDVFCRLGGCHFPTRSRKLLGVGD
jgi:hypothetical protein